MPEAPPPTTLLGVKKAPIAKPVIIVPNIVNKTDFIFFTLSPLYLIYNICTVGNYRRNFRSHSAVGRKE